MHFIFMIAYKYGMGRPGINIEAKSLEIIRESFLSLEDISFNFLYVSSNIINVENNNNPYFEIYTHNERFISAKGRYLLDV